MSIFVAKCPSGFWADNLKLKDYMEPKDLKNSDEFTRPVSDDSEMNIQATDAENPASEEISEIEVIEVITPEEAEVEFSPEEEFPVQEETVEQPEEAASQPADVEELKDTAETDPDPVPVENTPEEAADSEMVDEEPAEALEANEEIADSETAVAEVDAIEETQVESVEPSEQETSAVETLADDITINNDEEKPETKEQSESAPQLSTEAEPEKMHEDHIEVILDEIEDTESHEEEEFHIDYNQFSQIELVNTLRDLIESEEPKDRVINLIIAAFNMKVKENNAELKKQFTEGGGNPDDFVAEEDPYENDIKELLKKYRQTKFEQAKKMDAEKEINLQKKYAIIEDIKNLLNTEESINRTFQEFRDLQRHWYELGPVPQSKMKDLWDTYHFHVENFYDYIKINKELRDLDLKKNLEMKISLCEKAEELMIEPSVIRAFNTLQKYHEQWREIGPVPRDKKDDIWERFKAVTTAINQKHQEFFEKRKVEQKRNLDAKIALCEKVEEINSMEIENHRDWDDKSKQLVELQKVWRTIGFAPKRDNNKIYDRFRNACDQFFNKKRDFYSQSKEVQNKNMQMKIDLCMEAEALKESDDWKKTTQQFIDIQKRWKEIGPVPRKHSDLLWKRFRAACDYFFDRKSEHFSDIDDEQVVNLKLKKTLIEEVESYIPESDVSQALKVLREFQRRWTEIGHVPIKEKDAIQNRFRAAINKHFDSLKLDNTRRDSLQFRSKIATMTENNRGLSKVRQEREKYMAKLKQLETDLTLLDNNIGFFANSKNAQALIADVNQKIEDTREKIEMLKDKIRIIDELDKSEY
jgi:hypothetical protein